MDCYRELKDKYKDRFRSMDLEVLKDLLDQYKWERVNKIEWNGLQIEAIEEVLSEKE